MRYDRSGETDEIVKINRRYLFSLTSLLIISLQYQLRPLTFSSAYRMAVLSNPHSSMGKNWTFPTRLHMCSMLWTYIIRLRRRPRYQTSPTCLNRGLEELYTISWDGPVESLPLASRTRSTYSLISIRKGFQILGTVLKSRIAYNCCWIYTGNWKPLDKIAAQID